MYKHFAVFTVLVTGGLALATGDGNADSFNSTVDQAQHQVAVTATKVSGVGEAKLVQRASTPSGMAAAGWGADDPVPEHRIGTGSMASSTSGFSQDALERIGLTLEQFAAMSPEERDNVARRLAEAGASASAAQRQVRKADIVAASLARSGASESCEDC
jgi:hypothetical protein